MGKDATILLASVEQAMNCGSLRSRLTSSRAPAGRPAARRSSSASTRATAWPASGEAGPCRWERESTSGQ